MSEHTKEPWEAQTFLVVSTAVPHSVYGGKPVAHTGGVGNTIEESKANAKRIAQCVSACKGLVDPSVVPEMLGALEAAMRIESLWAPDRDDDGDEAECQALSEMRRAFVAVIAKAKGESVE